MPSKPPAVILLSGGLDSATTLAEARAAGFELFALTVRYGQRHSVEIEAARRVAEIAAVRRYDEDGSVGYLSPAEGAGWYRAAIGEQQRSHDGITLRGVTISIHVWPVD